MVTFIYILFALCIAGVFSTLISYMFADFVDDDYPVSLHVSLWTIGTIVFSILFLN